MTNVYILENITRKARRIVAILVLLLFCFVKANSQTEAFSSGAFIVNMGVVPQNVGNALKPYGMVYDLIKNYKIPIKWVISPTKLKDGIDFTYSGIDYKGGPFIVASEYRSPTIDARIAYWQTQGVVGVTTTSPISVPVAYTLSVTAVPRWTMDLLNGSVAVPYFTNAGIPPAAYSLTRLPSQLAYCDDIFVMPHAYPQWGTHSNLYFWNLNYKGSIWLSCTAGSELEDMFNLADHAQQTNFLTEKDPGVAFPAGTVTTVENALVLYNHHTNGTPPYTYTSPNNPFMQFMGVIDGATQNGLEQVYLPKLNGGWRTTTTIGAYDPDHLQVAGVDAKYRAAIIAFGRGFGLDGRGYVMIEAAHSLNNALLPANIAAQRVFFNFSFMAGKDATLTPDITGIPTAVVSGSPTPVSFVWPSGAFPSNYTVSWATPCGGVFAADPAYPGDISHAIFTPPAVNGTSICPITVTLTDICGRVSNASQATVITCDLQLVTALTNACYGSSNGTITMAITLAPAPYVWSWTKTGGGSGSGSGTTISGLAPGDYTVSVTSGNGAGCGKTFTVTIGENPAIGALSATPTAVLCYGLSTGSILVSTPSGGTSPYTYLWNDAVTTQNRSGIPAGTYAVTATDASHCAVNAGGIIITQPDLMVITPSVTNVLCNGQSTGAISLGISGGTGTKTYLWNDGATAQNRTGLPAGTYAVTVTDANFCTRISSGISVTQATGITASASAPAVGCNGGTSTITVTASGGTPALQYSINGISFQAGNTFVKPASASPYTITVKDANNCSTTTSAMVTQPDALSLSTTISQASCPGVADGGITLTVSGGTGPYNFDWADLPGTNNAQNRTSLVSTSYSVTVTDAHGCTASISVTVSPVNPNPVKPATINH